MTQSIAEPWLIKGDFNAILTLDDRLIGNPVQESETRDFNECITQYNLVELPTVEKDYTWTNGHVFSRIDKVLVNADWVMGMSPTQIQVM